MSGRTHPSGRALSARELWDRPGLQATRDVTFAAGEVVNINGGMFRVKTFGNRFVQLEAHPTLTIHRGALLTEEQLQAAFEAREKAAGR